PQLSRGIGAAALVLLNQAGDDFEYLLRAVLQRCAPDILVGLVRLIEIARPADQRNHPGPRTPAAVRAEQRAADLAHARDLEQRALERGIARCEQWRHHHR